MKKNKLFPLIIAVIFTTYIYFYIDSSEVIKITVTGKERITTGIGKNIDSKFIIYTENEVFENTDSWIYFKFNSSDFQGKFKVEETYEVKVAGWRIPFLSMYRNIVSE